MFKAAAIAFFICLPGWRQPEAVVFTPSQTAISGTWVGPFKTAGPSGTMRLDVARAGESWKCELKVTEPKGKSVGPVKDCRVEEAAISFTAEVEGATVKFDGRLRDDKLSGSLNADNGGRVIPGTWEFTRRTGAEEQPKQAAP